VVREGLWHVFQLSTATLAVNKLRSCRLACQHDGVVYLVVLQVGQDVAAALAVACRQCDNTENVNRQMVRCQPAVAAGGPVYGCCTMD
jgi:hypothetical protein